MFENFILKNKKRKAQEFLAAIEKEAKVIPEHIKKTFIDYMELAEHSPSHKHDSIEAVYSQTFLVMMQGTFFTIYDNNKMVAYGSWNTFNDKVSEEKLKLHKKYLTAEDYNSGDNLWLMDVIAPFGHYRQMIRMLVDMKKANPKIKNSPVNYRRWYGAENKERIGRSVC